MSTARCLEADCDWEANAPTNRAARALLERHYSTDHNAPPF